MDKLTPAQVTISHSGLIRRKPMLTSTKECYIVKRIRKWNIMAVVVTHLFAIKCPYMQVRATPSASRLQKLGPRPFLHLGCDNDDRSALAALYRDAMSDERKDITRHLPRGNRVDSAHKIEAPSTISRTSAAEKPMNNIIQREKIEEPSTFPSSSSSRMIVSALFSCSQLQILTLATDMMDDPIKTHIIGSLEEGNWNNRRWSNREGSHGKLYRFRIFREPRADFRSF